MKNRRTRLQARTRGSLAGLAAALALLAACGEPAPVRVAAPAEIRESGLLDALVDAFASETGVRATAVDGAADLEFRADEGSGIWWVPHVVLGPPEGVRRSYGEFNYESWARGHSPLGNSGALVRCSASDLFGEIRLSAYPVVSRGDGSATHQLEGRLWKREVSERGSAYVETGGSMARTLAVASEKSAYALSDLATYLRLRRTLRLALVLTRDEALRVPYAAILADGASPEARRLHAWLRSERCRAVVREFRIDGERAFYQAGEKLPPTLRGRLDPEAD